jgi:tetratricopeptide (TPR) repeat protein
MKSVWVKIAFVMTLLWWAYLFFTTQFVVVFDAEGYEESGRLIAHQGWAEFLRHGPGREPMFAGLVALSMHLGNWFGISYHYPLKVIGFLFLLLTMIFSFRLMSLLSVRSSIAALTVLYMGLSPVMTNSSIRLWSEFAAYPWVVLAVIWTIKSWKYLSEGRWEYLRTVQYAALTALMFLLVMSVKAVAEGILFFYLWPFYWQIMSSWRSKNLLKARHAAVFCLVVLAVFEGVVGAYRTCNYFYNGHFTYTTRGDWAFYGNTARRMQPLTPESLGAAAASVPGMGLCTSLYSPKDCEFWSAHHSDDMYVQKLIDLNHRGITGEAASRYYVQSSIQMLLSNPLQALLLMAVEAHKMFFWESSVDFVTYPDWLDRILHTAGFSYSLRIIFSFLSWPAFIFAFYYIFRRQKHKDQQQDLFWVANFVFWYMAVYSLFFIVDRYSFPLISLFLVLIASLMDRLLPLSQKNLQFPAFIKYKKILIGFLVIAQLGWFWLVPHIIREHRLVEEKSKFLTLSYDVPDFRSFAEMVSGTRQTVNPSSFRTYYQKAVNLLPNIDAPHYLLGYCEFHSGNPEAAIEQFQKSIDLNPDFFWSYYNLGVIYLRQGDFLKSAFILNKALTLRKELTLVSLHQDPFYAQIWRYLEDPGKILESNLNEGIQDSARLLADCLVKAGHSSEAQQIIKSVGKNTKKQIPFRLF